MPDKRTRTKKTSKKNTKNSRTSKTRSKRSPTVKIPVLTRRAPVTDTDASVAEPVHTTELEISQELRKLVTDAVIENNAHLIDTIMQHLLPPQSDTDHDDQI